MSKCEKLDVPTSPLLSAYKSILLPTSCNHFYVFMCTAVETVTHTPCSVAHKFSVCWFYFYFSFLWHISRATLSFQYLFASRGKHPNILQWMYDYNKTNSVSSPPLLLSSSSLLACVSSALLLPAAALWLDTSVPLGELNSLLPNDSVLNYGDAQNFKVVLFCRSVPTVYKQRIMALL